MSKVFGLLQEGTPILLLDVKVDCLRVKLTARLVYQADSLEPCIRHIAKVVVFVEEKGAVDDRF